METLRFPRRRSLRPLLLAAGLCACSGVGSDPAGTGGADDGGNLGTGGSDPSGSGSTGSGATGSGSGSTTGSGGAGAGGTGGTGGPVIHPTCPGDAANAYEGVVVSLPGTIEAENFDVDGFSDADEENQGGAYRTDVPVDVKELGDGYAIGWGMAGEWLEYTVNVPMAGEYAVTALSGAVGTGRSLQLSQCGADLGAPIAVPNVSDWGIVEDSAPVTVQLLAGVQVIRVTIGAVDYADLDALNFEYVGEGTGGTGGTGGSGGTGGTGGSGGTGGTGALPKFVGNITTGNSIDYGGRVFSTYWDQITPENAGKWGQVQPTSGSAKNWAPLTAIYDYAMQKGIVFKQHVFVWGSQQPTGTLTQQQVQDWISEFCERFPNTALIDVVNEPPPHTTPSYANAIGGGTDTTWQWVINSFEWAHDACPNAVLIMNDYNNIEYESQTDHFIDIAQALLAADAPIDALGAQAHGLSGSISAQTMKNLLTKMHNETGLPIYITEYDIDLADNNAQLAKYQEHIPFFMDTEWIHGVTLWGWIHGQTWIPNSGLIQNGNPRPAMTWLMSELGRPAP